MGDLSFMAFTHVRQRLSSNHFPGDYNTSYFDQRLVAVLSSGRPGPFASFVNCVVLITNRSYNISCKPSGYNCWDG